MPLYNQIGTGYARTRLADPRITARFLELLAVPSASTLLDVGAGTGKYARALADAGEHSIFAVEPSEVMVSQQEPHPLVTNVQASAESIPLPDASADAALVALAWHHFSDRPQALAEIHRVTGGGRLVLLVFDPSSFRSFWLADYFPQIGLQFRQTEELTIERLSEQLQAVWKRTPEIHPFPLPPDLADQFGAASWARPEAYLRPEIRQGISDFALMPPEELEPQLQRLEQDLESGAWDERYGALRTQESYEVGYRFVVV